VRVSVNMDVREKCADAECGRAPRAKFGTQTALGALAASPIRRRASIFNRRLRTDNQTVS
jgi:hypothetical protein